MEIEESEYIVRDVMDRAICDGDIFYYRVQWDVFNDPDDNTWEEKCKLIKDGHITNVCEINAFVTWRDQLIFPSPSVPRNVNPIRR